MSVIRVGSTNSYAEGWDAIFGGRKTASKKAAGNRKPAGRKAKAVKAKKSAPVKAAKKKPSKGRGGKRG